MLGVVAWLIAGGMLGSGASPAIAATASFTSLQFGFVEQDLVGLPELVIDAEDPVLPAADPVSGPGGGPLAVELIGTTQGCLIALGSGSCQSDFTGIDGPFSAIVSFRVSVLDLETFDGPFTLILTHLGGGYSADEVAIVLDPTVAPGFDPSGAQPGFEFDPNNGIGGFDPFVSVRDEAPLEEFDVVDFFLGWTVEDGDLVTFRYEVSTGPNGRTSAPGFSAAAVPLVVPEPGTALLLGLGLAGLTGTRRRRA